MRHTVLLLGAGLLVAALASGAHAAAIIGPETFETGATYNWSNYGDPGYPGVTVSQLGNSTTPPDPFGPSTNHSLMLQNTASTGNARVSWWNHSASITGKGTVSADLYTSKIDTGGSSTPYMAMYVGNNPNTSSTPTAGSFMPGHGQAFYIYSSNTTLYVSNGAGASTLNNTWTVGAAHQVTLNFDYASKTFSGTLDGNPLKSGTTTTFAFASTYDAVTYTSIDAIDVLSGFSNNNNSRVIVDNLTLAVPEPGMAALLGLGGLGLLMRRRRTAAR